MKTIIYLLCPVMLLSYSCTSHYDGSSTFGIGQEELPKTAQELRDELVNQERSEPLVYLFTEDVRMQEKTIQTRRAGFFHDAEYAPDGALITGNCRNKASIAQFKDLVIKLIFYSETNSVIETQQYVIYKYFPPNSITDFSIRIKSFPEAMRNFDVEVVDATAS